MHLKHLNQLYLNNGEGNGNPLQYSCLENPMDGGAWATVHGSQRVGHDWATSLSLSWLIGEDFDAGRDWGQEEKGATEDEMAGWHHWLDGHEAWRAAIHGVTKSRTQLSGWTELNWTDTSIKYMYYENNKIWSREMKVRVRNWVSTIRRLEVKGS